MQNPLDGHGNDSPPHPDVEAAQRLAAPGRRRVSFGQRLRIPPDLLTHPVERLAQALGAERLEEVVEGLDLERRHGISIEGGRKNNVWMMIELVEDLESVALRHPDVQEQQVGAKPR